MVHTSITDPASLTQTRSSHDESGTWPPAPTVTKHVVTGALADRVRRRLTAPADADVTLTEETVYGGYSEWTRENETTFTVSCNGAEVVFQPDSSEAGWRDDCDKSYDSVYARFDAWLAVSERPLELFNEWFVHHEEAGKYVQYRSVPDTILHRAARNRHWGTHHLTLVGAGDDYGREWTLDCVASEDANGARRVLGRTTLCYEEGLTITEAIARAVLYAVTDDLMFGRAR